MTMVSPATSAKSKNNLVDDNNESVACDMDQ